MPSSMLPFLKPSHLFSVLFAQTHAGMHPIFFTLRTCVSCLSSPLCLFTELAKPNRFSARYRLSSFSPSYFFLFFAFPPLSYFSHFRFCFFFARFFICPFSFLWLSCLLLSLYLILFFYSLLFIHTNQRLK